MRRDTAGPLGIRRVRSPLMNLFLLASRSSKAKEQIWKIWRGGPMHIVTFPNTVLESLRLRGEPEPAGEFSLSRPGGDCYRRFLGREFAEPAACEGRLAKGNTSMFLIVCRFFSGQMNIFVKADLVAKL